MRDIEPSPGEERIETWFAWWPVTIDRETRWLERVTVRQIYAFDSVCFSFHHQWIDVAFL